MTHIIVKIEFIITFDFIKINCGMPILSDIMISFCGDFSVFYWLYRANNQTV